MDNFSLMECASRFKSEGLTPSVRFELRQALTPCVSLKGVFQKIPTINHDPGNEKVEHSLDWSLELTADYVRSFLDELYNDENWNAVLPELLPDFTALLREAFDLMHELEFIDHKSDRSYIYQPAISRPFKKDIFQEWTVLIDLTRDAWLAAVEQRSLERALIEVDTWRQQPYPLFRRLVFFAATKSEIIPPHLGLEWLLEDDGWWLWSAETELEALQLLAILVPKLNKAELAKLEEVILGGPPQAMFGENIDLQSWTLRQDQEVYPRLAKIHQAGDYLSEAGHLRLASLLEKNPQWQLADDEREESPYWNEDIWVGDKDPWRTFVSIPRRRRGVMEYLLRYPELDGQKQDDWSERCKESFQATTYALYQLARQENLWPTSRWRNALRVWSQENLHDRSWKYMAPVLIDITDEQLSPIAYDVAMWLRIVAKSCRYHEKLFLSLSSRILALDVQDESERGFSSPIVRAINHLVGHVTEALLLFWQRDALEDGLGLPRNIRNIFTGICDIRNNRYRHGRLLLAAHAVTLFRVDQDWTTQYLLPLFDWQSSEAEARGAWFGYLWSPRVYRPLMEKIKLTFLDTAKYYSKLTSDLDGCNKQYASLLVFGALDLGDMFKSTELASAVHNLPQDGLNDVAEALVRALKAAGDRHADFWKNRISPFLKDIWPRSRENSSPSITRHFSYLCIEAGDAFPDAFKLLHGWLQPSDHFRYIVDRLYESKLCRQFYEPTLDFLDKVLDDQTQYVSSDKLKGCLEAIRAGDTRLENDNRFDRLVTYLRQQGGRWD